MTNSGGGDPSDPLRPIGPGALDGASRARGIERAEGAEEAAAAGPVSATAHTAATEGTDAIAQALAAGEIDPATARALLLDEAIAASLPPGADPALAAELRAEIEAVLAADPTLQRLLTP
jgi:hypothetical protein